LETLRPGGDALYIDGGAVPCGISNADGCIGRGRAGCSSGPSGRFVILLNRPKYIR